MYPFYPQIESSSQQTHSEQSNLETTQNEEASLYQEMGTLGLALLKAEHSEVYKSFLECDDEKKLQAVKYLSHLLQAFNSLVQHPQRSFSMFLSACGKESLKAIDEFFKGECVVSLDDIAAFPFKKISFFNSNFQKGLTLKEKVKFFGRNSKPIVSQHFPYTIFTFSHKRAKMELDFQKLSKKNKINLRTKNEIETTFLSVLKRVSLLRDKAYADFSEAYIMWLSNKQIEESEGGKNTSPLLICFSFIPPNNDYRDKIEAFIFCTQQNLQAPEIFAHRIANSLYRVFEKMDSLKKVFPIDKIKVSVLDLLCPPEILMYEGVFENGLLGDSLEFLTPEQMVDSTINKIHLISEEKRIADQEEGLNQRTMARLAQEETKKLIKNLKQEVFDKDIGLLAKASKKFVKLTFLEAPEISLFSYFFEKEANEMFERFKEDMNDLVTTFKLKHIAKMVNKQPSTPQRFPKTDTTLETIEEEEEQIEEQIKEQPSEKDCLSQPSAISKSKKKRSRTKKANVKKTKAL